MNFLSKFLILCVGLLSFLSSGEGQDLKIFTRLAKQVKPSVVNISITKKQSQLLQMAPGFYVPNQEPTVIGSGSGFVIDRKGLIVTNAHVVSGASEIKVQFEGDQKFYTAKVLGADRLSDIALLKINAAKSLTPVRLGNSQKVQVGEWVAAFGNPHNYGHTMTKGIISAVKREIDELNLFPLLQTDASINPGNSGGPLVNLKGEVVGVNNAIAARAQGISFAIPINNVKNVLKDLKKYGFVRRGFIGVRFQTAKTGILITEVVPNSPAGKAGIQKGDVLIQFEKAKMKRTVDLVKNVAKTPVGKRISIHLLRNGKRKQISLTIGQISNNSFSVPKKSLSSGTKLSLGFKVSDSNKKVLSSLGLPHMGLKHPVITSLNPSSLAQKAGLEVGDFIFKANDTPVSSVKELKKALQLSNKPTLHILRYHESYNQYLAFVVKLFK